MSGFLSAALALAGRLFTDLLVRLFSDWRRDRELVASGEAKADARANAAAAEAERRAAAVPAKSEDQAIDDLDQGQF